MSFNKLKIFREVALHLSFTKASEILSISQPSISKTIRNIEDNYKTTLFIRNRNSIELTEDGKTFLVYANKILEIYTEMETTFLYKNKELPQILNLGASTTLANYILPKILSKLIQKFPDKSINLISENSEDIEDLILNQTINFGIIEGINSNPMLHYEKFVKDEIVLVSKVENNLPSSISLAELQKLKLIEREIGSGTKDVIYNQLKLHGIEKLNIKLCVSNTESIKQFLLNSDFCAFISIHAVTEDLIKNNLKIIDIEGFSIERWFYFVTRTGFQNTGVQYLKRFLKTSYNF